MWRHQLCNNNNNNNNNVSALNSGRLGAWALNKCVYDPSRLYRNHRVSFDRNQKRLFTVVTKTKTDTKPVKTSVSASKTKLKTKFGWSLIGSSVQLHEFNDISCIAVAGAAQNPTATLKSLGISLDIQLAFTHHVSAFSEVCNYHLGALHGAPTSTVVKLQQL